ncbi:Nucleoside Triphosphate Pyrophosphohydrolase [Glutamicibacter phage Montesquieu]|nr:Nucleoside Triphosphate Pyrophosphohydrolase [Glutamicibacter phage Montesquieu]
MSNTTEQLLNYMSKAKATAQPEAYFYSYLIPGLLGEVGEVYGQIAKNHWHGWSAEKFETELVAEYGDICWMTAILMDHRVEVEEYELETEDAPTEFDPFIGMQVIGERVNKLVEALGWESDAEDVVEQHPHDNRALVRLESLANHTDEMVMKLWAYLVVYAPVVTGHPLQKSLDYNAEKLASRAARGVLRGAGDHR